MLRHALIEVLHLPMWRRLIHQSARRHVLGFSLGWSLMLTGSHLALHPTDTIPRVLWDAIAYGVHGLGFIPLAKHAEPLWQIVTGK